MVPVPARQDAIDKHEEDILERARHIVLCHHKQAVAEQMEDGRWTLCLSPNRLTFMCWSASEREVWIDYAILLATGEAYPMNEIGRKVNRVRFLEEVCDNLSGRLVDKMIIVLELAQDYTHCVGEMK